MRLSDFWERLEQVIEPTYIASWRSDIVLPTIGLTVDEAVTQGIPTGEIWRAVCEFIEVPKHIR